ncbi:uncharacterized protein LOC108114141 [Drosophila eugracilis]|uniref:uncharacterized protein LOC108114141 n=1 Tax=Drosophila eugracilis TaxID=29029 RepID=UPI0007E74767|nr:uncharacterized protein LOC108114141 [Drosophila eugracilis]
MRIFLLILNIFGYLTPILTHVTFTNLKCGTKDKNYAEFGKCSIKAVNRTHKYMDIHVNLYQKPVRNITVIFQLHVKLMRRDHGYKLFFMDVKVDICMFLKQQRQPFIKMIYDMFKNNSNINHTCPYDHDILVDHLWTGNLETNVLNYIPLINGDYALFSEWSAYNVVRAFINLYVRVSDTRE